MSARCLGRRAPAHGTLLAALLLPACLGLVSTGPRSSGEPEGRAPAERAADRGADRGADRAAEAETSKAAPAGQVAPKTTVVAVFDVEDATERFAPKEIRQLGDYLATRVAALPSTRVVPREQLRTALGAAKAESYRACVDQACQIELGKAVSAEKSLATKLLRVGSRCAMTASLFDLKTETTERAASAKTDCAADELFAAVDELVRQLGGGAPRPEADRGKSTDRLGRAADHTAGRASAAREEPPIVLTLDESGAHGGDGALERRETSSAAQAGHAAPKDARGDAGASGARRLETSEPGRPEAAHAAGGELRLVSRRGSRLLVLPAPVNFARGRDDLDPAARRSLELAAAAILRDATLGRRRLEVVGHAESTERGKAELSERRARAARAFLLDHGLTLARLGLAAASDSDPLSTQPGEAARAQNRRVELRIADEE